MAEGEKTGFDRAAEITGALALPAILALSFAISIFSGLVTPDALDVVASMEPADGGYQVVGRVLRDGAPVPEASVVVVVSDGKGNRSAPPPVVTDSQGGFATALVPSKLGGRPVADATVEARKTVRDPEEEDDEDLEGRHVLVLASPTDGFQQRVDLNPWVIAFLPGIFLVSFAIPLTPGEIGRLSHAFSLALAFLFTGSMVVVISLGLDFVNSDEHSGHVLSLGFATLFQGTYVPGESPEWLFSLTAAPREDTEVVQGFGAPLWVLLVAVIGAALMTVSLIVGEISKPPQPGETRARVESVVRHQFFVMFAPIGALFVYQILVAADAAREPLTVALAALGAGLALNELLKRAVTYAKSLIEGS